MKKSDRNIIKLIKQEESNELKSINLIPSENLMSPMASKLYGYRVSNKYFLPIELGGKTYMPGREFLDRILKKLIGKISSIYNVDYVSIKGLSGLHQMEIIFMSFSDEFKDCLILKPEDGGHFSTEYIAKKFNYNIDYLKLNYSNWDIDTIRLKDSIEKFKDKKVLMYIDHTIVLKPLDVKKILKMIPKNWVVYYDISHLQLFYLVGLFKFPKDGRFFFGGSTHKSFPGPQKAILLANSKNIYEKVRRIMDNCVSSFHTGSTLALLITLIEMENYGHKYAKQIIENSQDLARLLSSKLKVVGPSDKFTFTHQICIDVEDVNKITNRLSSLGIITTPMRVPSTNRKGLRLGVQEITRLGMKKNEIKQISEVIINGVLGKNLKSSKSKIIKLSKKFNKVHYCFDKK